VYETDAQFEDAVKADMEIPKPKKEE